MKGIGRWCVRGVLYLCMTAIVARLAYHVAHSHYAGPSPDDSDADLGFFFGVVWAGGTSAFVLLVCAAGEGLLVWCRASDQARLPRNV